VVIVGPGLRAYLEVEAAPDDPRPVAIRAWLDEHGYALQRTVDDPSYGRYEIFVP
jgi:hypothetical protein